MARASYTITNLNKRQPLFRGFCFAHGLGEGDEYCPLDYITWSGNLTLAEWKTIQDAIEHEGKILNSEKEGGRE